MSVCWWHMWFSSSPTRTGELPLLRSLIVTLPDIAGPPTSPTLRARLYRKINGIILYLGIEVDWLTIWPCRIASKAIGLCSESVKCPKHYDHLISCKARSQTLERTGQIGKDSGRRRDLRLESYGKRNCGNAVWLCYICLYMIVFSNSEAAQFLLYRMTAARLSSS